MTTSIDVKNYFLQINRRLTLGLIALLVIVSMIFWYTGQLSLQNSSSLIGAGFMLLAVIFYQMPYVSFLITRRKFANHNRQGIEILDAGWKVFRKWLDD